MANEFIPLIVANSTKYPFLLSSYRNMHHNDVFFLEEESIFNRDQCSFFMLSGIEDNLISYRFIQEDNQHKVYIDCSCFACRPNFVCESLKCSLVKMSDEIDGAELIEKYKDAEFFINTMNNSNREDQLRELLNALEDSNSKNNIEPLIAYGFTDKTNEQSSNGLDWKVVKKIYLNNLKNSTVNAVKTREEMIYVLHYLKENYYGRGYTAPWLMLSLHQLKKTKDKNKFVSIDEKIKFSDLKGVKFKLNEVVKFESNLDKFVSERFRDSLLDRKASDAREAVGSSFSEIYIYPQYHDIIEEVAKNGKLYLSRSREPQLDKLEWTEGENQLDSQVLNLDYNEKLNQFVFQESVKTNEVIEPDHINIIKIPGFLINKNIISKIPTNDNLLLKQISNVKNNVAVKLDELNFFISFLNEQNLYPLLKFNNINFKEICNVEPAIECKVELASDSCSIVPVFKYEDHGFLFGDLCLQHIDIERRINFIRNHSLENKILSELASSIEFSRWGETLNIIDGHDLIKKLDNQKVPMTYKNKKINIAKDFGFTASSGIDWVDIKGEINFGDLGVFDIIKLKAALNKGPYIEFKNGEIGLLPNIFAKKYKNILDLSKDNKNGVLRINKLHSAFLDSDSLDELNITPDVTFEKFLQSFEVLNKSKNKTSKSKLESFNGDLRKYQLEGLNWLENLYKTEHNGILADDMGLGKTVQVIAHLSSLMDQSLKKKKSFVTLIIVPKSLLFNWKNEFNKFNPKTVVEIIQSTADLEKLKDVKIKTKVFVVTYHFLRSKLDAFIPLEFNFIVLDEAQNIKNENSQITQAVLQLKGERKLALTGTPIENSLLDLASIFEFLYPGSMTAALKAKLDARGPKKKAEDSIEGNQFLQVFATFVRPMILRRTKKQVLTDLPPKIEKNVYLEFSEIELKQYETLKKAIQYSLVVDSENKNNSFKIIEGILRLRQICLDSTLLTKIESDKRLNIVGKQKTRSSKINSLIELLQDVIAEGSKAIVFSQFSSFLEIVRSELSIEGLKTAYIDGQTKDREGQVNKFKLEKDCQVMLSTLKTGGVGLNLTEAEYVFIMDPWWNPAAENQAIDRAHRIGQSKSVMVYKLIMKDSIEEKVVELQNLKKNVANSVLELGDEGLMKTLNKEEISSLFE